MLFLISPPTVFYLNFSYSKNALSLSLSLYHSFSHESKMNLAKCFLIHRFVFYRLNRQLSSMSSLYFSIRYSILFVTGEKKNFSSIQDIDCFSFLLFRFLSLLHSARQTAGTLVEVRIFAGSVLLPFRPDLHFGDASS